MASVMVTTFFHNFKEERVGHGYQIEKALQNASDDILEEIYSVVEVGSALQAILKILRASLKCDVSG